jgi:activator of HSP90 ATPase
MNMKIENILKPATRRQVMIGSGVAAVGLMVGRALALPGGDDSGIHAAESIHQEVYFEVKPKQLYEALTDARQFQQVVQMSAAMKSMSIADKPAEISREAGGAFSLFGGYLTGRQIELIANQRIVQAWRAGSWSPGEYSIAKFELVEQGSGTRLTLDHRGFPDGQAQHLAAGWQVNYWEPLKKYLAPGK